MRNGTVTASSARAGAGAVNVQSVHHGQEWRTLATVTAAYLLVDFGASYSIGCVYLGNHNLSGSGTWRVRLSTADATGAAGDAHDSTAVSTGVSTDLRLAVRILSANVTARYLRVDLSDATLPNLSVGRLWAGKVWKPANNFSFGAVRSNIDHSNVVPGGDGTQWVSRGARQPWCAFTLPAATSAEVAADGLQFIRKSGISEEVLVCLDPAATDIGHWTYLGLMEDVPAWEMAFPGRESASFRVRQRL